MMDKKENINPSKWNDFSAEDFEPFTGFNTERYENGEKKEEGTLRMVRRLASGHILIKTD